MTLEFGYLLILYLGSSVHAGNQPYTVESVNQFKDLLEKSQNLLVLSGHGMTIETGGVTYRAANQKFRGRFVKDIASHEMFNTNPPVLWQFFGYMQESALWSEPHRGHKGLARLERRFRKEGRIMNIATHNDDDLHQRARSRNVIEMYGSRFRTKCTKCGHLRENRTVTTWQELVFKGLEDRSKFPKDALPHCELCDGLLRPDVVWFDEKMNETIDKQIEELAKQCDLYLEIGVTPTIFTSKTYLPIIKKRKVPCAEFNMDTTPVSKEFTFVFKGPVAITVEDITMYWNRSLIGEQFIFDTPN